MQLNKHYFRHIRREDERAEFILINYTLFLTLPTLLAYQFLIKLNMFKQNAMVILMSCQCTFGLICISENLYI